jgi:hypothetical protein
VVKQQLDFRVAYERGHIRCELAVGKAYAETDHEIFASSAVAAGWVFVATPVIADVAPRNLPRQARDPGLQVVAVGIEGVVILDTELARDDGCYGCNSGFGIDRRAARWSFLSW